MKIYTKTGDGGETGLLGGDRIGKDSLRIEVIGGFDELNAYVGVTLLSQLPVEVSHRLSTLQSQIFDMGSELACPPGGKFQLDSITTADIEQLEAEIDQFTTELPELKNFILPGGTPGAAHLHFLRAICRRLERNLLRLSKEEPIRSELIQFLNRLSDWTFCAARLVNFRESVADVPWSKGVK